MKRIIILSIVVSLGLSLYAQGHKIEDTDYRRSSIYSLLINHTEQPWGSNIADLFSAMPLPDKYNNHDLSVKIITIDKKTPLKERGEDFLKNNHVASHMVAKWFNRNPLTGVCDMDAHAALEEALQVDVRAPPAEVCDRRYRLRGTREELLDVLEADVGYLLGDALARGVLEFDLGQSLGGSE